MADTVRWNTDQPVETAQELEQQQVAKAAGYVPTERDQELNRLVEDRLASGESMRKPHESEWYVTGAFLRGHQYVEGQGVGLPLTIPPAPARRIRLVINRILPKWRARLAKFLKNRPVPVVVPATTDLDDRLDARATTKALEYAWRKLQLEKAYSKALRWAGIAFHGYWWFSWDPSALAKVQMETPAGPVVRLLPVGDIEVEVGSPFELVVGDATCSTIGDQPWIVRTKRRPLSYIQSRFPDRADFVVPDGDDHPASSGDRYAQQLGKLTGASGAPGVALDSAGASSTGADTRSEPYVLVKEMFERPTPKFPRGRYLVAGGGVLLKEQEELPYFSDYRPNPYPCVDFVDFEQPGQYWGATLISQIISPQREYNLSRSKLAEHKRLMVHPKVIATTAHQIQPGTWTADAGEVLITAWVPGLKPPLVWTPPPISGDIWRGFELLKEEISDIMQIFPESEGRVGQAQSGFQTNLLQEATDAVHGPDIRAHELVIEEAAWKIRRLMKLGYSPARLLTVTGKDLQPEAFEFHREDIDESADVIVQAGSALPGLKAAKAQAVMDMWSAGLLGDPADPVARQRALSMLELGTNEDAYDSVRRDEEYARLENEQFKSGQQVRPPEFFENHDVHYRVHTDDLKSASAQQRPPQEQMARREHIIRHVAFVNPQAAVEHAARYGMTELAQQIMQEAQMAAQAAAMVGGGPPVVAPQGAEGAGPSGEGGGAPAPPPGGSVA